MHERASPQILRKVRRLAQLPEEVRQRQFAVSVTRLTVLKGLCQEPEVANRFVTYLARRTLERIEQGKGRSAHRDTPDQRAHHQMMTEALEGMESWQQQPTDEQRHALLDLKGRMQAEQNEHQKIAWGSVRLITDWELLLFEYALSCLLNPAHAAGYWAYQAARHYAERYDSRHGTGLIPASAPLVQDIAVFWLEEFDLTPESITAPSGATSMKAAKRRATTTSPRPPGRQTEIRFTPRQGQFLAFIHLYRKLHRQGPAELDMAKYFRVTPPAVHGMIVKLEQLGLVTRERGVPRSVRVTISADRMPSLEEVEGPPW